MKDYEKHEIKQMSISISLVANSDSWVILGYMIPYDNKTADGPEKNGLAWRSEI